MFNETVSSSPPFLCCTAPFAYLPLHTSTVVTLYQEVIILLQFSAIGRITFQILWAGRASDSD